MSQKKQTMTSEWQTILTELKEIGDIIKPLHKSDALAKADDDQMPQPEQMDDSQLPANDEGDMSEEGGEPQSDELEEAAGEDPSDLAGEAAQLSDEQLEMMLNVLMDEHDKRHGGEAAPEAAPAPEPAPLEQNEAEKSMGLMHKTIDGMKKEMDTMKKSYSAQINKLNKDLADSKKRSGKIVSKPATYNTEEIEVLEKSKKVAQRLSKSETIDFILGRMRQGDRQVNVRDVSSLGLIKDGSKELYDYQDGLKKRGVQLPEL